MSYKGLQRGIMPKQPLKSGYSEMMPEMQPVFQSPSPMSDCDERELGLTDGHGLPIHVPRSHLSSKLLRYGLIPFCVVAAAVLVVDHATTSLIEGLGAPIANDGLVSLVASAPGTPYKQDSSCPDTGGVCFCSNGYIVIGKDSFGVKQMSKGEEKYTACQEWKFRVGDVIFVAKPAGNQAKYREASIVSFFTQSPYVHTAIVTKIPAEGTPQTAETVVVTEALKGVWKKVVQNNVRTLVERYPFGGISMRRVDMARFPNFFTSATAQAITAWGDKVLNQPFDNRMVNPIYKRFGTQGRFIPFNPSCSNRVKADTMYTNGGPGQWICAQLVAWTLAFPGGLNVDKTRPIVDGCSVSGWVVKDVQPNPGSLLKEGEDKQTGFFELTSWHMPCEAKGCWVGVPTTSRWTGGLLLKSGLTAGYETPLAETPLAEIPLADPVTPNGLWTWSGGPKDATITGTTLTDGNGVKVTLSDITTHSFKASDGYLGGSATYKNEGTVHFIQWSGGTMWNKATA